jgi:hypothetical protein
LLRLARNGSLSDEDEGFRDARAKVRCVRGMRLLPVLASFGKNDRYSGCGGK